MDRTRDFKTALASVAATARPATTLPRPAPGTKSEFILEAASIGGQLKAATIKLDKLAKMVQNKSVFAPTMEINELTFVVKQDIINLNHRLDTLQAMQEERAGRMNVQTKNNAKNIMSVLKNKLYTTSQQFEQVIVTRTEVMQQRKQRDDLYTTNNSPAGSGGRKAKQTPTPFTSAASAAADVVISMPVEEVRGQSKTGGQLALQQSDFFQSRAENVENLERALGEVADIFKKFTTILAEQQELVRRIDDDIEAANTNVELAQNELLQVLQRVSSNRGLMLKIFAVLVVFIFIYAVFIV